MRSSWTGRAALALAVLVSVPLAGCSSDVTGRVVSGTSGQPVTSATVTVGELSAQTDANGGFAFTKVKNGEYEVSCIPSGYPKAKKPVVVGSDLKPFVLTVADSAITGKVTETAVEPKAIATGTVQVAGQSLPIAADGSFSAQGLIPGETTMTVVVADHMPKITKVTLKPGANSVDASVSLTPQQTYQRYFSAYKFSRYKVAYKYVHPDQRKKESYAEFAKSMSSSTAISLALGQISTLGKWKSKSTGKTYANVTEIDRSVVYQIPGYASQTDNLSQHWIRPADGNWYIVFNE